MFELSTISLIIQDGVLTAKIETPSETYHIEPSWRHLGDNDTQAMIAYKESDILFSWDTPHPETKTKPEKVIYKKKYINIENTRTSSNELVFDRSAIM